MADEPRVLRDLRVHRPEPRGIIIYGEGEGQRYRIRSLIDLKKRDARRLLELDNPAPGTEGGLLEHTDRIGERIKLLCPDMPDEVLEEMTYSERVEFENAALAAGPVPLVDSLTALLAARPGFPCAEACEHSDCPPLREVVLIRDKLRPPEEGPTNPAPATEPGASSPP